MAKNRKSHNVAAPIVASAEVVAETANVAVAAEAAVAEKTQAEIILALPQMQASAVAPKLASAKKWPKHGGKCFAVWQKCQQLADTGMPVSVGMLRDWAVAEGANVSNATQEFYAWRKYVSANS